MWLPLSFVVMTHAGRTLVQLMEARLAWAGMMQRNAVVDATSLQEVQQCLEKWRRDYKRGGAQAAVAVARIIVSASAAPILGALIVAHIILVSVEKPRFLQSALLACVLLDVTVAAILYVAGEITELMSSQREFFISVRLRVAESCYELGEQAIACTPDDGDGAAYDMRHLYLFNAIQTELCVLEAHTGGQSFVVYGFSIDSGRASHFLALVAAVFQQNWSIQWLDFGNFGVESPLIVGIFLVNAIYLAYRSINTRYARSSQK